MTRSNQHNRGFTITRRLSGRPEEVFRAWTEPEQLRWFFTELNDPDGPIEVDLRVGGWWRQRMVVDADGTDYQTGGLYLEVEPPKRLVFAWGAPGGWPDLDPAHPEHAPIVTVELAPAGDGTEMSFILAFDESMSDEQVRDLLATKMYEGWSMTIDRLVDALAD